METKNILAAADAWGKRFWWLGLLVPWILAAACASRITHLLFLEDDLSIMLPEALRHVHSGSFGDMLRYLAETPPENAVPILKLALMVLGGFFGADASAFLWVTLGLHGATALLLALVCRELCGYGRMPSLAAGSLFLACAALFHAWVWPVAIQHQLTVLAALSFMALYAFFARRERFGFGEAMGLAVVALAISWFRVSILLAPASVVVDNLFREGTELQTRARWRFLLPSLAAFVPAALYFVLGKTQGGILTYFNSMISFLDAGLLVLACLIGCLFWAFSIRIKSGKARRIFLFSALCGLGVLLLAPLGFRGFWGVGASLSSALLLMLAPGLAFRCDTLYGRWHALGVLDGPLVLFGMLLLLFLARIACRGRWKESAWLAVWLVLPQIQTVSVLFNSPYLLPSRYYVYLMVPISILLGGLLRAGMPERFRRALWVAFAVVALSNVVCLDQMLRGTRLAAAWWNYDYISALHLERAGLGRPQVDMRLINGDYIERTMGISADRLGPFHPFHLLEACPALSSRIPASGNLLLHFFPGCSSTEEISRLCGGRTPEALAGIASKPGQFFLPVDDPRLLQIEKLMKQEALEAEENRESGR